MKIGFLLSPQTAVSGMSNGILKQAYLWAEGLRSLGQEVDFLGVQPDGTMPRMRDYDLVHFFQNGFWLRGFQGGPEGGQKWVFSPILDSTSSPLLYGALALLPLEQRLLSFGPSLLRSFCMLTTVSVRSSHERGYIERIAPKARVVDNPIAVPLVEGPEHKPRGLLPEEFALFVGNVTSERKNVARLIQACEKLKMPLVLAGLESNSAYARTLWKLIDEVSIPVHRLGFVTTEELRWLYQNCSVFCLPSVVEGVGQVAMEAMYFGAPVVVTRVGGPPDYFGDHAEYVDPHSVTSIHNSILRAINSPRCMEAAKEYIGQYSVASSSKCLLDSYLQ